MPSLVALPVVDGAFAVVVMVISIQVWLACLTYRLCRQQYRQVCGIEIEVRGGRLAAECPSLHQNETTARHFSLALPPPGLIPAAYLQAILVPQVPGRFAHQFDRANGSAPPKIIWLRTKFLENGISGNWTCLPDGHRQFTDNQ